MDGLMDYYVCDAEGNIVQGPFQSEADASDWLYTEGLGDWFVVSTGACDIEE